MKRRQVDDEGATLILVLLFMALFGVFIASMLDQASTNLKRTIVTRAHDEKVYAADAGVDAALQKLRNNDTLCPTVSGSPVSLPTMTINGKTVTTTCQTTSGAALGANGYALITTDPTTSGLVTLSAAGEKKPIEGPVFTMGMSDSARIDLTNGDLLEHASAGTCSSSADQPANVVVSPTPPYSYSCVSSSWTAIDPAPALGSPPAMHASRLPDAILGSGSNACYVFRPGSYNSGITLGPHNYFASGTYYFPSQDLTVRSADVTGGAPADGDVVINSVGSACAGANDKTLNPSVPGKQTIQGTGVTVVLGGTSVLTADNPSGLVELYTRTGGLSTEGASNVSIRTVPNTAAAISAGWLPSSLGVTTAAVLVGNGTTPALSVHGLIYAPGALVDLNATNTSVAQFVGGIVAARLRYQSSASAGGIGISIQSGPGRRRTLVTATASESGARSVVSTALVDISNDGARTIKVIARTNQPG